MRRCGGTAPEAGVVPLPRAQGDPALALPPGEAAVPAPRFGPESTPDDAKMLAGLLAASLGLDALLEPKPQTPGGTALCPSRDLPTNEIADEVFEVHRSAADEATAAQAVALPAAPQAGDVHEIELVINRKHENSAIGAVLRGLCVQFLRPNSPGAAALAVGDTITAVAGHRVETQEEFLSQLACATPGPICFTVLPAVARQVQQSGPPGPPSPMHTRDAVGTPSPPGPPPISARAPNAAATAGVCPRASSRQPSATALGPAPPLGIQLPPGTGGGKAASAAGRVIVLNCEDISRYANRCPAFQDLNADRWQAVARAVAYYEERGFAPQGVVRQVTTQRSTLPVGLAEKLVQCPVIDSDGRSARAQTPERLFALRLAQTYGCPFVDNSNYREPDWEGQEAWDWLQRGGADLKIQYVFDCFGQFVPSRDAAQAVTTALGRAARS